VAGDARDVDVARQRPGLDELATRLPNFTERSSLPSWSRSPELFVKFPARYVHTLLILGHLALGNRPGALVAFLPEGASGMDEQDLELAVAPPVEHQTGTPDRAFRRLPHARQQTSSRRRGSGL